MSAPITLERKLQFTADEWDAFTARTKNHFGGSRKKIKVNSHRRDRRQVRILIVKGHWE